jgi:hypothetical protein
MVLQSKGDRMQYAIKSMAMGEILDQAVNLTKNHFKPLFTICCYMVVPLNLIFNFAIVAIMPEISQSPTQEESKRFLQELASKGILLMTISGIYLMIFGLIIWPITNAAMIHAVASEYLGKPVTPREAIKAGTARLGAVLGTSILGGIVVGLGFLALVIPGFYLLMRYYFAINGFVPVIEERSGTDALSRSGELMRGNYGTLFVLGFILFFFNITVGSMANMIPVKSIAVLLQVGLQVVGFMAAASAGVVFYFSSRCKHENFDLTVLAEAVAADSPDASTSPVEK